MQQRVTEHVSAIDACVVHVPPLRKLHTTLSPRAPAAFFSQYRQVGYATPINLARPALFPGHLLLRRDLFVARGARPCQHPGAFHGTAVSTLHLTIQVHAAVAKVTALCWAAERTAGR